MFLISNLIARNEKQNSYSCNKGKQDYLHFSWSPLLSAVLSALKLTCLNLKQPCQYSISTETKNSKAQVKRNLLKCTWLGNFKARM